MCKILEEMINDEKIQFTVKLLARHKDTFEEIAELTGLSIEMVKEISNEMKLVLT